MIRLRALLSAVILAAFALFPTRGDVVLNEFLASNQRNLADRDGDYSDWIEIFNSGPATVNLTGWSLTDEDSKPHKWTFPATNLNAGTYLLVFASGKDRTNAGVELHTSFSINADGEYLALFPPESDIPATEFAPEFPRQQADVSFGLSGGQPRFFNPPTPRAVNGPGFANFVADTKFSHDRGFFDQPFDLVITCATAGATISYTTNGAPPTATSGLVYSGPIAISGTKVIRAAAFKTDLQPSGVDTQTYLFADDIFKQAADGKAPPGWPTSWGNNVVNYGMDPDIVNSATYKNELRPALMSLPSFVVVTELRNLFDAGTGIYANAGNDGRGWERPASLELINPDGTKGFQVNCGIRIRGGFSRDGNNPKHAFRFFFREEYGAPKLRYPLFGDDGTDTFDNIDLRTFQNYSWSFQGDSRGVFFRDQFSRDAQLDLGYQSERGNYYHLFINGQYWGLYNTCERPEASYGETYFGGQKEDFDVIKVEAGPYTINATDGNLSAWQTLYAALRTKPVTDTTYLKLQGLNPDGTPNPAYPILLDVDNLIDYMLVMYFGGNLDAPISDFLGNSSPNNFYGMRDRTGRSGGFKFFAHDAEHTLLDVNQDRTGPFSAGSSAVSKSNPQYFFQQLTSNSQFRLRVADRIQRAFFNGGPLTVEANRRRVAKRTNEIASAVVLESARWGDSKRAQPFTRNAEWQAEVNRIQTSYFPQRATVVSNQFRAKGWLPAVIAPSFSQHGGPVNSGSQIAITAPAGSIYYTTDGSDPRLPSGGVSPSARTYSTPLELTENTRLQARARSVNDDWSAVTAADFQIIQTWTDVLITELMYHPTAEVGADPDDFEFVELKNVGGAERDLGGVQFTNGIRYTFPNGTRLAPGSFLVLASRESTFTNRYPEVRLFGIYAGKLANSGERLTLIHAAGAPIFDVTWTDQLPWPPLADGGGFSLVPRNPNANPSPNDPAQWRASVRLGGSPGQDDPVLGVPSVVINELLAHTDPPDLDAIELYNPSTSPADVSGWFLSDDRKTPKKYRIPGGRIVPPGGYLVFNEADFNRVGDLTAFTFSSHGDEAYLFSADSSGNLTGYSDGWSFGASATRTSFGRYTNSVGEVQFTPQRALTLEAGNAGPTLGPIVLNEFNYNPFPGDVEFVELKNISDQRVLLFDSQNPTNTWKIVGMDFAFPEGTELPPGGLAVVTAGDPTLFRLRWSIPDSVLVLGPVNGNLANTGERLDLQRPDSPDTETNQSGAITIIVPYISVDTVRYSDLTPWPEAAGGQGASLERIDPHVWADDPSNWRAATAGPSPGFENSVNRPPHPDAGADQLLVADQFPVLVSLLATADDDGQPGGPLQFQWTQSGGPIGAVLGASQAAATSVALPGQGVFTFRVIVSDGERTAFDEVVVQTIRGTGEVTLLPAGSTWRYSDLGQNFQASWREPDFNDSAWKSGPAKLGYGDENATTIGFGPDSGNKYITSYFRTDFNVTGANSVNQLTVRLLRDDGAAVYLNGTEVVRSNLPEAPLDWKSPANSAIGGADEFTFYDLAIDRGALREGRNVLAVEVHQSGGMSSDLGFDLALVGRRPPGNIPPTAQAGPDLIAEAGALTPVTGTYTDDALPQPPGVPVFSWTKVSGPGEVVFSNPALPKTAARFSVAGQYRLQFVVNDGELNASDEAEVTVTPNTSTPLVLEILGEPNPRLRFTTAAGRSYSVVAREKLDQGEWLVVYEVPVGPGGVLIEIPISMSLPASYYQVISPNP